MSESTYSSFLAEKQLQRKCIDLLNSSPLGDFLAISELFPEKNASGLQKTYRFFKNADATDFDAFKLTAAFVDFSKKTKSLAQKQPFYLIFGDKIRLIQTTQETIQSQVSKILKDRLTISSPFWDSHISKLTELLRQLKKHLSDLMDCEKFTIHFPEFKQALTERCEKEINILNKELRRFDQLLQSQQNYPVEDFFLYLPDMLESKLTEYAENTQKKSNGRCKDLIHFPGQLINAFIELYLKLQLELVNARKIRPSSKVSNTFLRKTLADYFEEKIEFAKSETIYTEEDRNFRLQYLKAARQEVMEKI